MSQDKLNSLLRALKSKGGHYYCLIAVVLVSCVLTSWLKPEQSQGGPLYENLTHNETFTLYTYYPAPPLETLMT